MSSDWLFVLVFYPSLIFLCISYKIWRWVGFANEEWDKIYKMGKRHGKEELAIKIYGEVLYGEDEEEESE